LAAAQPISKVEVSLDESGKFHYVIG
jgi:hypothetical protein